jgi:hypothetical protein
MERIVQKSIDGANRIQADGQAGPNEGLQATATTEAFGEP